MGYNTPVLIYNDMLGNLERDPDIGLKISRAIGKSFLRNEPERVYAIGGSIGVVLPSTHADDCRIVAVGGNTIEDIGHIWNGGRLPRSHEEKLEILRYLANDIGYNLHRKRK